ncbi:hypothetical protein ACQUDY_02490, partial [Enterococcus faecium]
MFKNNISKTMNYSGMVNKNKKASFIKRNPFHFIDYCIYYKKRGFVINCHASFTYEIFSRVKVF